VESGAVDFVKVSAFITVAVAATYILGFLTLGWPIYRKITRNSSTTIYAVFLMPTKLVAGQGIRIFGRMPLMLIAAIFLEIPFGVPIIIFSLLPLIAFFSLEQTTGIQLPDSWNITILKAALIVGLLLGIILAEPSMKLIFRLVFGRQHGPHVYSAMEQHIERILEVVRPSSYASQSLYLTLPVVFISLCAISVGIYMMLGASSLPFVLPFVPALPFVWALLIFLFGILLLGVPEMLFSEPPLVTIEIIKKSDAPTLGGEATVLQSKVVGKLLDHSGGVWYFFNNQDNELTVIPDAQVSEVRVKGDA